MIHVFEGKSWESYKMHNIPRVQNAAFLNIKVGSIYRNQCALKCGFGAALLLFIDRHVLPH
jgi:hypothetical protein